MSIPTQPKITAFYPGGANGDNLVVPIPDTLYRWAIVLDKQSNGTQPAIQDIYQWYDAIAGTAYTQRPAGLAPMNLANRERFITLKTGTVSIGQLWNTSAVVDEYIDLRGWETIFGASQQDPPVIGIGTINTGALYLVQMIYSHNSDGNTGTITINTSAFTRVRFEDV